MIGSEAEEKDRWKLEHSEPWGPRKLAKVSPVDLGEILKNFKQKRDIPFIQELC